MPSTSRQSVGAASPSAYSNGHCYPYRDGYCHCHPNSYSYRYGYANCNSDPDGDSHRDGNTNSGSDHAHCAWGYKVQGTTHSGPLLGRGDWEGDVDIYRNGVVVATGPPTTVSTPTLPVAAWPCYVHL